MNCGGFEERNRWYRCYITSKNREKNIKENELDVEKIQRKGEDYYYITSEKNTLEIKIDSGKITRVNSVAVE